jgi:dTDP-4-dehydrorhamnose reductase
MSDLNFVAPRPVAAIMQQNGWQKIGFNSLPSWEDALDRASVEMKGLVF